MKKINIIITSILLVITCMFLTGCSGFTIDKYNYKEYSVGNFTYSKNDIFKIEVNWINDSVTLVTKDDVDTFNVKEQGTSLSDDLKMRYLIKDHVLYIKYAKPGRHSEIAVNEKDLTIEMPKNIDIKISTVSSNVKAENMDTVDINIKTVSGNVNLTNTTCKEIDIATVSGNVTLEKLTSSSVDVSTAAGNVYYGCLSTTKLDCKTTSGKIGINPLSLGKAKIYSVSGTIDFDVTKDFSYYLKFSSVSGEFSTNTLHTKQGKEIICGDGSTKLDIETVSACLQIVAND